jgi:hypothetical protein
MKGLYIFIRYIKGYRNGVFHEKDLPVLSFEMSTVLAKSNRDLTDEQSFIPSVINIEFTYYFDISLHS